MTKAITLFWRALVTLVCLAAVTPLNAQQPTGSLLTSTEVMILTFYLPIAPFILQRPSDCLSIFFQSIRESC